MSSIFITGDIHGDPTRLGSKLFKHQKDMIDGQDNNFVIICGDFGLIWNAQGESGHEKYWLDWLEEKPFTTLWVDGNHECFDRIYSDEYPVEVWHGGRVQKIRPHVIHLMRGEVYNILGHSFFAFGGASSHDIKDGILDPDDKETIAKWRKMYGKEFRINHESWWKEEIASEEEMNHGVEMLKSYNNNVDFIITHCLPQGICCISSMGMYERDKMTEYFDKLAKKVKFKKWFSGHYHKNATILGKYDILYEHIVQIV